jgi:hypothetical protein
MFHRANRNRYSAPAVPLAAEAPYWQAAPPDLPQSLLAPLQSSLSFSLLPHGPLMSLRIDRPSRHHAAAERYRRKIGRRRPVKGNLMIWRPAVDYTQVVRATPEAAGAAPWLTGCREGAFTARDPCDWATVRP